VSDSENHVENRSNREGEKGFCEKKEKLNGWDKKDPEAA